MATKLKIIENHADIVPAPQIPDFEIAPTRKRHAGWTADKQRRFIEHVALTGNVGEACALVGVASSSAYRLRNKAGADSFKRKLLRIEAERAKVALSHDEIELVRNYADQMADVLKIGSAETIHGRTKNPLVSLKILMSIYRRVRTLAEYQNRGKAHFDDGTDDDTDDK